MLGKIISSFFIKETKIKVSVSGKYINQNFQKFQAMFKGFSGSQKKNALPTYSF